MCIRDRLNIPLRETIKNNCMYDREFIEELGKKYELCPFELSLDLSYMSDIVICDYNYYFDPRVALKREDLFNKDKDIPVSYTHLDVYKRQESRN